MDDPNVCTEISWRTTRKGTAHGFVVWFDSELVDGICFSNHPAASEMIYGSGFFPFSEPVEVAEGDHIKLQLTAKLIDDDYVWRWDTVFPKASFKQSTFYGVPLSQALLKKARQ